MVQKIEEDQNRSRLGKRYTDGLPKKISVGQVIPSVLGVDL